MNAPLSQNSPLGKKVIAARSRRRQAALSARTPRRNYFFSRQRASVCLVHGDHLNTPRLATNQQGQKIWSWEGSAFGNTTPTGSVTINLRKPGEYWDEESSLTYNHNRYYSSTLGRFLTPDPRGVLAHARRAMSRLRQGGGRVPVELNPYAYVGNNPLRWTDRLGLEIVGEWKNGILPTIRLDYVSGSFSATSPAVIMGWGAIRGEVHCRETECDKKEWDDPVLQDLPVTELITDTDVTADWFFSQSQGELISNWQAEFDFEHLWTLEALIARGPTFWCRKR